ncbi:MAG: hypothetical protein IPH76_18985 [Xanthomonadales bacterium]|nr:hypothetical protein [Xanthomonadales bacterium]
MAKLRSSQSAFAERNSVGSISRCTRLMSAASCCAFSPSVVRRIGFNCPPTWHWRAIELQPPRGELRLPLRRRRLRRQAFREPSEFGMQRRKIHGF